MPKESIEQVRRQTELIRKLTYEDGLNPTEIKNQLQIAKATVNRYLNRIRKEDAKDWNRTFYDPNLVNARARQLERILENGLAVAIKQMNDTRLEAKDQREAVMLADIIASHLLKLSMKGPTFSLLPQVKATLVKDEVKIENKRP